MAINRKRLAEMKANPYDRAHGTLTGYGYGCRCPWCGAAMSDHMAAYYRKHAKERRAYQAEYRRRAK